MSASGKAVRSPDLDCGVGCSRPMTVVSVKTEFLHGMMGGRDLERWAPIGIIPSAGGRHKRLRKMARFGAENAIARPGKRIFAIRRQFWKRLVTARVSVAERRDEHVGTYALRVKGHKMHVNGDVI